MVPPNKEYTAVEIDDKCKIEIQEYSETDSLRGDSNDISETVYKSPKRRSSDNSNTNVDLCNLIENRKCRL